MALDIYSGPRHNQKRQTHIVSLDYDLPEIQRALRFVEQQTGLVIDVYGKNIVYHNHCQALLQGLALTTTAITTEAITKLSELLNTTPEFLFAFGD